MSAPRIAIIGAGIGGLTLAVALKRLGLAATVYEGAPQLSAVGAGIWLPANAMKVMEHLKLDAALSATGVPLDRVELADQEQLLSVIELQRVKARLGQTTVSIMRSELQRVLLETVGEEHVVCGKRAVSAAGGAVKFEDGTSLEADVIVGADGLRSAVREAVVAGARLEYSGQTCWRGMAKLELPEGTHQACRETWGGPSRFGYSAVKRDCVYWFAVAEAPSGEVDASSPKPMLTERFAGFPPVVRAVLAATRDEAIFRSDIWALDPIARWSQGPYVLLGDAAHAMTPNLGQGGAQAIEDAFSLARCLKEHTPVAEAYAAYERERGPRARRIAKLAGDLGRTAHWTNGVARALRNVALRSMPKRLAEKQTDSIFGLAR